MKMLVHREPVSEGLPFFLDDVKRHCRVLHDDDDTAISAMAETAAAEIENFAQIALLKQTVRVTIFDPSQRDAGLRLPIGPVAEDHTPTVTLDGVNFTAFRFEPGLRPYIHWQAEYYDLIPERMTVEYEAGFGTEAASIPRDLAQALMDQAALHFSARSPMDTRSLTSSPHMARIGARYRGVQL